jgi:hypothetical protein
VSRSKPIAFTYDIGTGQQQMLRINPRFGFYAGGINQNGSVVGLAQTQKHGLRGFVGKASGGHVKLLNFPGRTHLTVAVGINDSGAVVGYYHQREGTTSGFIFQSNTYTSFDPPGSTYTQAVFITDDGVIGGNYRGVSGYSNGYTMAGGTFMVIDYPAANSSSAVIGIGPAVRWSAIGRTAAAPTTGSLSRAVPIIASTRPARPTPR